MATDYREQVLRAMGGRTKTCANHEHWHMPSGHILCIESWWPDTSLDDVRAVEEWLAGNGHAGAYVGALSNTVPAPKYGSQSFCVVCASAAERWQACVEVMIEAKLIERGAT